MYSYLIKQNLWATKFQKQNKYSAGLDWRKSRKVLIYFLNILESGFGFINEIIMSFRLSRGPNVTEVPSFTIKISNHVYQYCFQHALSTQTEEIMGLLIGEMKEEENVMEIVSLRINRRLGMISHKMSLITIFGRKHKIKNFIKIWYFSWKNFNDI